MLITLLTRQFKTFYNKFMPEAFKNSLCIFFISAALDEAPETLLEETGPFQRASSGGFFNVLSLPAPKQDLFAPSRIIDLRVTAASYEEQLVEIQFTAVGDDLDKGRGK